MFGANLVILAQICDDADKLKFTGRRMDGRTDRQKLGCLNGFTKMNIKWSSTLCPTRAYVVDHLIYRQPVELSGHLCVLQGFLWSICIPLCVWTNGGTRDGGTDGCTDGQTGRRSDNIPLAWKAQG